MRMKKTSHPFHRFFCLSDRICLRGGTGSFGRLTAAMAAGLLVTMLLSGFSWFAGECDEIRQSVLRLHILANSDTAEDQALKLAVRDRILGLDAEVFGEAETLEQAREAAGYSLAQIEAAAREEIRRQGYDYPVRAELAKMYFTTREYENFTLPAGNYEAVRVTIGSGEGHNWWCVLYPPLCLPAAEGGAALADVLSPEQAAIVSASGEYEFRFAAVELYEQIRQYFSEQS